MNSQNTEMTLTEIKNPSGFTIKKKKDFCLPFTQSWQYGVWQERMNRRVRRFIVNNASGTVCLLQAISYPFIAGKRYMYIPHGPIVQGEMSESFLESLRGFLQDIAREENAVFTRFDVFPPILEEAQKKLFLSRYFKKTPDSCYRSAIVQPKYDWTIDLRKDDAALLSEMHQKTRYNIRLAQRKGIRVSIIRRGLNEHFDAFFHLLKETGERNGFSLHPREYYRGIFEEGEKEGSVALVLASFQKEVLACNCMFYFDKAAHYLYGGSSEARRDYMPAYLAQWEAIGDARKRGCIVYNFGGVTPSPGEAAFKDWGGISRFKKYFGGTMLAYSDLYDSVNNSFFYHSFNARKRIQSLWR